ncbi:hypothetical protein EC968_007951 [Mortierella alpina]|nr:hypothetical protein EC968_007951 [Mortierella alpina]
MSQPYDSPIPLTPALLSPQSIPDRNPDHGSNGPDTVTQADATRSIEIQDTHGKHEQPLVQPVSDLVVQPVSELVVQPVSESLVQAVSEPLVHPVAEPVVEHGVQLVIEPVAQPVIEPVAKPVNESVAKPAIEPVVQPFNEPVAPPFSEPSIQAVIEPVVPPVNGPAVPAVIEPAVQVANEAVLTAPPQMRLESDVVASLSSGPLASSPRSGSPTEIPSAQPSQSAQGDILPPSDTTITDTALTEASMEQPLEEDKKMIPTEAILTEATAVRPVRRARRTKRMKSTIAEPTRTLPARKVKETKRLEATLAKAVKTEPSRKAKGTVAKPTQTPIAEDATTRPSKRAKVTEPSEASKKPKVERPSKRAKGASSSVQDTGTQTAIPVPVQQAGRRGGTIAKPKPLKRGQKSSKTGAGVEKSRAIAQSKDEHDSKTSLTVAEETGSSVISTEQSPSTQALAADNPDVTRKRRRKIKAAPVNQTAPQQPLGRDEPTETVCEQVIDPVIAAKRHRGRSKKLVGADPISQNNDPKATPSGDSVAVCAPTADDTTQEAAPRPRQRARSKKGAPGGTTNKKTEPKESPTKKQPTKSKPKQTRKALYEDDDERMYEEAIKDRGVRIWETFPMDSNGCIDKWAQMLGVPMRTLPISEEKECLTFPFDMQELQATGSADRVRAFIFFGPDSLQREPPKGDTDSFAIPFLSQQSVGYGHAVDSCASLSFLNIAMNCPDILENGPASMQQLRATLDDEEKVQSIKHAWRVFDQSVMGEQVHEVHNRIAVAEDSVSEEHLPYNPKKHMRKTRYSQRKAQAMQQDTSASAPASASEQEQNNTFHFTALMKIGGHVWELDSMETEPIRITSAEESDWHMQVSQYLQALTKDLSTYQKNYNCRLIAVV